MNIYKTAGLGLMYLFWGKVITLFSWDSLLGTIVLIAGGLVQLYGLYTMSKAKEDYKLALVLTVVYVLLNWAGSGGGFLGAILSSAAAVADVAAFYLICNTTGELLQGIDPIVAQKGMSLWKVSVFCTVVDIVCEILALVPLINILAVLVAVVSALIQIVIGILYMIFLWKSQKALRGAW